MSYILHPKSSIPHLKSMHWGKHSVQHSTLCIIHSTSYIATYILFPDVQHSAMSFVLHSKYSLLSVRCITPYILDLTVHLTSYILCSASHFLPCDIHPGSDTDERKVLYHTLYGHFICLNPISDIINSSPYIYCSSSIFDPMGYNLHTAFYTLHPVFYITTRNLSTSFGLLPTSA